uniref:Uncharacterized protein n=1 Tax=Minutocellus polymorphus TaxID=265543 RepID=A0A7S0ALV7_9STRA|eukprot:CAMPEP_0197722356 /NCGR_PEP_ID=MMETSP1434-20131217/5076_1 /TAXON_ID=265543 /ORGANISM="Minutocellus polymorphus, Strain CCMP3303" /LENGTH=379 /DNA_ID=CAMNT_0043307499 /DNA_START=31 /DNA_END=1170 /DNA_ORIENTATION=-
MPSMRLILLAGGILLAFASTLSQPLDAAVAVVNVRREQRKCSTRRRKYRRLVTRKRLDYHYVLTTKDEDGFWDAPVVVRRGVIQDNEDEMEKDTRMTVVQIMNDVCKALRAASASPNSRQFFDVYEVKWRRVPTMSRIFFPATVNIAYAQDDNADVGAMNLSNDVSVNYQIKDFRLGVPDAGGMSCPTDVMECDDGSFLSREPPSCDFAAACPGDNDNVFCTDDVKECADGSLVNRDRMNNCRFYPCKGGITRGEILSQKSKWLTNFNGVLDYEFTYKRMCFCYPDFTRPRRVVVRDGKVVEVRFADGGGGDASDFFSATPTIEEIFDEIAGGADSWYSLNVNFDPAMGYPLSTEVDEDVMLADEERNVQISNVVITAP